MQSQSCKSNVHCPRSPPVSKEKALTFSTHKNISPIVRSARLELSVLVPNFPQLMLLRRYPGVDLPASPLFQLRSRLHSTSYCTASVPHANSSSICNMKLRMTVAVAFLYLSLAMCVLGRPQPSSLTETSPQYSAMASLEVNHAAAKISSRSTAPLGLQLRFPRLHFPALNPFTQERRILKGSGGRVRGGGGGGGGGSSGGGGGAVGSMSTTQTIIIVVSIFTFVILLAGFLAWCNHKKRKNPNWRFLDCFKRRKPATAKLFTEAKSDADPNAEHKMTVDVPRLDHFTKSRKQASLHDNSRAVPL